MSRWMYRGVKVKMPASADVVLPYRPEGALASLVQQALNCLEPWEGRETSYTLTDLSKPLPLLVVPVGKLPRIWGKHIAHRAKEVGLSPFVTTTLRETNSFTIMVAGSPDNPLLVRAYAGTRQPTLPWQRAATAEEHRHGLAFWCANAYTFSPRFVMAGTKTETAPDWFAS